MLEKINQIIKNRRCFAAAALLALATAITIFSAALNAVAQNENTNNGNGQRAFGLTSGVIGIAQGQTARVVVYNKGDDDALVRLQFVDNNGTVLIQCDLIVKSGKAIGENFVHTGGVNRIELRAEILTNTRGIIGVLVPSVQVVENATGKTTLFADPGGLAEFRGVPNPPLPDN
jgi:hypothetical protein